MDIERARFNMVEQQIRPVGVIDPDVRRLLVSVKRENFVPPSMRPLAFAEVEVPLPCAQSMLKPAIEGRILEALKLVHVESILEVGAGTGYFAALLAQRADRVHTVEIEPTLARLARENLSRNGISNAHVEDGDGSQGWFAEQPYNVIVISGGLPQIPEALVAQIKPGGCLFAIVGNETLMKACIVKRIDEKRFQRNNLFETTAPMLYFSSNINNSFCF